MDAQQDQWGEREGSFNHLFDQSLCTRIISRESQTEVSKGAAKANEVVLQCLPHLLANKNFQLLACHDCLVWQLWECHTKAIFSQSSLQVCCKTDCNWKFFLPTSPSTTPCVYLDDKRVEQHLISLWDEKSMFEFNWINLILSAADSFCQASECIFWSFML